jgi:hypothetical protein
MQFTSLRQDTQNLKNLLAHKPSEPLSSHRNALRSNKQVLRGKNFTSVPSSGGASSPAVRWDRGGATSGPGLRLGPGLVCDWAYPCSIEVLGLAIEVAGERRQRSNGVAVTGARTPAWIGVVLIYV